MTVFWILVLIALIVIAIAVCHYCRWTRLLKRLNANQYYEAGDEDVERMYRCEWGYINKRQLIIRRATSIEKDKKGETDAKQPEGIEQSNADSKRGTNTDQAHIAGSADASSEKGENQKRPTRLVGLCLSGGGIRSATFNLGVIQALQRVGFLKHVDYLSTVSGGGYIGSCLMSLLTDHEESCDDGRRDNIFKRLPRNLARFFHYTGSRIGNLWPFCMAFRQKQKEETEADPHKDLARAISNAKQVWDEEFPFDRPKRNTGTEGIEEVHLRERAPVRWLRYYSNYLTAENSKVYKALSLAVLFFKGFVVNLLVILPYLMLAAFGLYAMMLAGAAVPEDSWLHFLVRLPALIVQNWHWFGLAFVFLILIILVITGVDSRSSRQKQNLTLALGLGALLALIVIHLLLSTAFKDLGTIHEAFGTFSIWCGLALVAGLLLLGFSAVLPRMRALATSLVSMVLQLFVYALLLFTVITMVSFITPSLPSWYLTPNRLAQQEVTVAIAEKDVVEPDPLASYQPTDSFFTAISEFLESSWKYVLPLPDNPSVDEANDAESGLSWRFDVPLAVLLLMMLLWFLTDIGVNINKLSYHNLYRDRLSQAYLIRMSKKEKVKETEGKKADDISPFDPEKILHNDGLLLSESGNGGWAPYHLINTTMNLSKKLPGNAYDMDAQDAKDNAGVFRRGENFILSRYLVGSRSTGYLATGVYEAIDRHLDLASAMAISGAALNVSMAEQTVSRFRLLFSLLNVRLGYWAKNPFRIIKAAKDIQARRTKSEDGSIKSKQEPVPLRRWKSFWFRLRILGARWTIAREWFGRYGTRDLYVNISDGGHFDNLGVYELLRRRCEFIVVSDAEADPVMRFKALSGIIRLARVDLGVDIDIDVKSIWKDESTGYSSSHCTVGTITYDNGTRGYLLYLKSSLTGDEPQHLHEYRVANPSFPHQTTADQWFDEHQFEVYRELGYHIAKQALEFVSFKGFESLDVAFLRLKQYWRSSSLHTEEMFTKHTAELSKIMDILREEDALEFMDAQLVRDWKTLSESNEKTEKGQTFWDAMRKGVEFFGRMFDWQTEEEQFDAGLQKEMPRSSAEARNWLPENPASVRKGFYLCSRMLQLMEDVYTDLNLEEEWDHPDNRGWINQFRFWSQSSMFQITWALTASTYGARFRDFCERLFGMRVIKADIDTLNALSDTEDPPYGSLMETFSFEGCDQGCEKVKREKYEAKLKDCRKWDLINPLEYKRIMKYIVEVNIDFRWLVSFKYRVEEEYPLKPGGKNEKLDFRYAIALIGDEKNISSKAENEYKLIFFRVQNQLRGIGLGRAALRVLFVAAGVRDISKAFINSLTHKPQRYPGHPTYKTNETKLRRMLESVICECDDMTPGKRKATGPPDATQDDVLRRYKVCRRGGSI